MRISDWSSDVCASDLRCTVLGVTAETTSRHSRERGNPATLLSLGRKDASVHSSQDWRLRVSPSPTPVPSPQPPAPAPSPPHVLPTIRGQVRTGHPAGAIGDEEIHRIGDLVRRSEEHTSELQSLMRSSSAVFCLKKKNSELQPRMRNSSAIVSCKTRQLMHTETLLRHHHHRQ